MDPVQVPRFLTIPRAAKAVGVGRDAIRAAVRAGRLRAVVLAAGGWPRVEASELTRWARSLHPIGGATSATDA